MSISIDLPTGVQYVPQRRETAPSC